MTHDFKIGDHVRCLDEGLGAPACEGIVISAEPGDTPRGLTLILNGLDAMLELL